MPVQTPNENAMGVLPREQSGNAIQVINSLLTSDRVKSTIKTLIPQGSPLTTDRVIKVVLAAVLRNKDLLKCSGTSIVRAATRACEVGLEPGGVLGHAYLVPINNWKDKTTECEMWLGYAGALELMRRSGQVSTIYAEAVKPSDHFEWEFGLEPKLVHKPSLSDMDPNIESIAFYAVAHLKDGGRQFVVMSRAQVEAIRLKSSGGSYKKNDDYGNKAGDPKGAWRDAYDEMAKKTVLKRLYKVMPKSVIDHNMADKIHELMSIDGSDTPVVIDAISSDAEDTGADIPELPPVAIQESAQQEKRKPGRPAKQEVINAVVVPEGTEPIYPPPASAKPVVSSLEQDEFNKMFPPSEEGDIL